MKEKEPGFLGLKNQMNVARWMWRWHVQGGGFHWRAHDMKDQRDDNERARWRRIELAVRQAIRIQRRGPVNIVNLSSERSKRQRG